MDPLRQEGTRVQSSGVQKGFGDPQTETRPRLRTSKAWPTGVVPREVEDTEG